MYRSVLVPLDGSPFAEHALPLAVSIARRASARLQLLTVTPPLAATFLSPRPGTTHRLHQRASYIDRVAARLREQYPVSIDSVVLESKHVAARISEYAEDAHADLVVMTTHGRGPLGRLWFGSTTYELLHYLTIPLLLIRPGDRYPEGEEPILRRILVSLDGSEPAERIVAPAFALGNLFDADYTLLRVVDDVPLGNPELDLVSLSSLAPEALDEISAVQDRIRREAHAYLEGIAGRLRAQGARVESRVEEAPEPAEAILAAAVPSGVDLVALETYDRHGLKELVLGGVARKILAGTTVPVLVQSAARAGQSAP